jgi:hypothetical protein
MAMLRRPFESANRNISALIIKIVRGKFEPVTVKASGLPGGGGGAGYSPAVRALVAWMLRASPAERPTMRQLLEHPALQVAVPSSVILLLLLLNGYWRTPNPTFRGATTNPTFPPPTR